MINKKKLDFYLTNNLNVLFEGLHGVGKTAIILDAFKRNNLRYAYFSGATMDPYVDFVGVPVKVNTDNGEVLRFIRPEHLVNLDVQAIFMDELNRAHKKVRNALMELIQFKTINGVPFSKDLKVIWAAINPDSDDEDSAYDTDRLDPAQRDRFQIQLTIPYQCDNEYFQKKFGDAGRVAIDHWNGLSAKTQLTISPRRLDYALDLWKIGGDLRDVLPKEANISALMTHLKLGPVEEIIKDLFIKNDLVEIKNFFSAPNNYNYVIESVLKQPHYINRFFSQMPIERQSQLYIKETKVQKDVNSEFMKNGTYDSLLTSIASASTGPKKIRMVINKMKVAKAAANRQHHKIPTGNINRIPTGKEIPALKSDLRKGVDYIQVYEDLVDLWEDEINTAKIDNYTIDDFRDWYTIVGKLVERKHGSTLFKMPGLIEITRELIKRSNLINAREFQYVNKYAERMGILY